MPIRKGGFSYCELTLYALTSFCFFLVAVSGEETQTARGGNIELETITTVTVHFRIMTVSTTTTTSIALRDKKGLFCHEQNINHFSCTGCNEAAGITKASPV